MNETNKIMKLKAEFYKEKNTAVHITKKNSWFHNGLIIKIEKDFLILDDEKEGELPIFFIEILEIQKREQPK